MAQTTDSISKANFELEVSTNGSSWTDISGASTTVQFSGGEQNVGSQNTAEGDAPVVTGSDKFAPTVATFTILYTNTASEAFDTVMDRWESGTRTLYVRYAPEGGIGTVIGNDLFTAVNNAGAAFACPITQQPLPPDGDAGSGDPAMATFSVTAPKFLRSTTTTA